MPRKKKEVVLPRGFPPKEIDWNVVDKLLVSGCNGVQIAAYLGIHPDTLYDRCQSDKGVVFSSYLQDKRAKGDAMIHAVQFDRAVKDKNIQMLMHLGKHRLNQKDKDISTETTLEELVKLLSANLIKQSDKLSND